jgi:hypothetical protein
MIIISFGPTTYAEDPSFKLLYERHLLAEIHIHNVVDRFLEIVYTYLPYCDVKYYDTDDLNGLQIVFDKQDELASKYTLVSTETNYHHAAVWYQNNVCVCLETSIYIAYCSLPEQER